MTVRREVPLPGDTLAWVHNEIAQLKSRLNLIQEAQEQSRALAADAIERAQQIRGKVDAVEPQAAAIEHLQEDLRLVRDALVRVQEDINSLRTSREEAERRALAESERQRKESNDLSRRLAETQRVVEAWQERIIGYEEHGRRNLEIASQFAVKIEALASEQEGWGTRHTRLQTAISRLDQEVNRISAAIPELFREDETQKERSQSAAEMLRRLESEVDAVRSQIGRMNRIDDRVELIQAERSRHGERLNELTAEIELLKKVLGEQVEKIAVGEARVAAQQDEARGAVQRLLEVRDQLVNYLKAVAELEADFRKRQVANLEKEARELRSRALSLGEE